MSYKVRFTRGAQQDLERLYTFILKRDEQDWALAERALLAMRSALSTLEQNPFTCRKSSSDSPLLRELLIPFGASGYVALFEIEDEHTITVLAVRHQRERDYY